MTQIDPTEEIVSALGSFLLRSNRAHLYSHLVDGVNGVEATTYPVLSGLARLGPVTATQLAEQIGLDRSVTTRYASRLEQAGLLARKPDPFDARATQLALTVAGRRAVGTMRATLRAIVGQVMQTWTPAETEIFARLLRQLTNSLSADSIG